MSVFDSIRAAKVRAADLARAAGAIVSAARAARTQAAQPGSPAGAPGASPNNPSSPVSAAPLTQEEYAYVSDLPPAAWPAILGRSIPGIDPTDLGLEAARLFGWPAGQNAGNDPTAGRGPNGAPINEIRSLDLFRARAIAQRGATGAAGRARNALIDESSPFGAPSADEAALLSAGEITLFDQGGDQLTRAAGFGDDGTGGPGEPARAPRALYWDPYAFVEQIGFRDRPSALTYALLDQMIWKMPILRAIIQVRLSQVAAFCRPQRTRFETGYKVGLRDPTLRMTAADKKEALRLSGLVQTCGVTDDPRAGMSFTSFARTVMLDSMRYDALCAEVIPDRRGKPAKLLPVDASTIRLADTNKLYPEESAEQTYTVQVYDNIIIAEFTRNEMIFRVRNPRSDIRAFGYGMSETEQMISTVTDLLYGMTHNRNFFANGTTARGILNLVGTIPDRQLMAFRRAFYLMATGVANSWRTPITNADKAEWIPMSPNNRDMEYGSWLDFLIKVACGIHLIDPVEISFKYGNSSQRSMFESANKSKLVESKDKGLKPLLRFLAETMDINYIWPNNPDYSLEFVGLDSQTPKELADLNTMRVRSMMTVDELRAENGYDPLPDGLGAVLLDATWMAARNVTIQRKAMADAAKNGQLLGPNGQPSQLLGAGGQQPRLGPGGPGQASAGVSGRNPDPTGLGISDDELRSVLSADAGQIRSSPAVRKALAKLERRARRNGYELR